MRPLAVPELVFVCAAAFVVGFALACAIFGVSF
jgi:hypothetical protein